MNKPKKNEAIDWTLDYMLKTLPPERITLATYIELNWFGSKTFDELDGEELAELPEELFPEPLSNTVN